MIRYGWRNVRKKREINNSENYIALDIYLRIDCLENREVVSSGSRDYVGISGRELSTYMNIGTKIPNNKQNERTAITDITNQYFRKLLNKFKNLPYLGYKKKHVHN